MRHSLFLFVVLSALLVITGCDSADPDVDLTGPATVTGEVLDSQTGDPVEGARVTLTLNNTAARNGASRTETTNSEGIYTFENMATGTFTMLIQSDGHLDVIIEGIVITDGINEIPPVVAPEPAPEGAYRIVLSWGQEPQDLDSHLTGPTSGSDRFHVYFSNRNPVPYAELDRDDVTSYGPETITVTPQVDGVYRYSVHNYSDQSNTGSAGIAGEIPNSVRARVQLYSSTTLLHTFEAPPSTPGNTWRVFELVASGGSVTINPINTYITASTASDMNAFRLVPKQDSGISVETTQ